MDAASTLPEPEPPRAMPPLVSSKPAKVQAPMPMSPQPAVAAPASAPELGPGLQPYNVPGEIHRKLPTLPGPPPIPISAPRQPALQQVPQPMAMPGRLPVPPPHQGLQAPSEPRKRSKADAGHIAENIPRTMRAGKTERIEIRIAKAAAKYITQGFEGGGVVWKHDIVVTQAMSVRLRAPEGGFFIETASPETQWIENSLGHSSDDYASWRFLATPNARGWSRLQIIVSARTVGADGMMAETAMPDQVIEVKVRRDLKRTALRWAGWVAAAVAGGALAKFGEDGFGIAAGQIQRLLNL